MVRYLNILENLGIYDKSLVNNNNIYNKSYFNILFINFIILFFNIIFYLLINFIALLFNILLFHLSIFIYTTCVYTSNQRSYSYTQIISPSSTSSSEQANVRCRCNVRSLVRTKPHYLCFMNGTFENGQIKNRKSMFLRANDPQRERERETKSDSLET